MEYSEYREYTKIGRREALAMFGAAGAALAFGCAADTPTSPASTTSTTPTADSAASCAVTPTETIGPYPSLTDLIRSDIREGKSGTRVTLTITVVNVNNSSGDAGPVGESAAQPNARAAPNIASASRRPILGCSLSFQ